MSQKRGWTRLRRWAKSPAVPQPPAYSNAPSSRETENDIEEGAVGTSRWSNSAVRLG
jgi:hypothetical protein